MPPNGPPPSPFETTLFYLVLFGAPLLGAAGIVGLIIWAWNLWSRNRRGYRVATRIIITATILIIAALLFYGTFAMLVIDNWLFFGKRINP